MNKKLLGGLAVLAVAGGWLAGCNGQTDTAETSPTQEAAEKAVVADSVGTSPAADDGATDADHVRLQAFAQGKANNCISVALIKAAVQRYGVGQVFDTLRPASEPQQVRVTLRDHTELVLTDQERRQAAGWARFPRAGAGSRVGQQKIQILTRPTAQNSRRRSGSPEDAALRLSKLSDCASSFLCQQKTTGRLAHPASVQQWERPGLRRRAVRRWVRVWHIPVFRVNSGQGNACLHVNDNLGVRRTAVG